MRSDMTFRVESMGVTQYLSRYREAFSSSDIFNPYTYYEQVKLKNFQESSRLEGVQVDYSKAEITLEAILNKYQS